MIKECSLLFILLQSAYGYDIRVNICSIRSLADSNSGYEKCLVYIGANYSHRTKQTCEEIEKLIDKKLGR